MTVFPQYFNTYIMHLEDAFFQPEGFYSLAQSGCHLESLSSKTSLEAYVYLMHEPNNGFVTNKSTWFKPLLRLNGT